jgi:CrcB protein
VTALTWALAVVACGAGSTVRYLVARLDPDATFPWTTMVSNVVGSAVLGATAAAVAAGAPPSAMLVLGAGFAGGLSTFSTLALDAVVLFGQRRSRDAVAYLVATAGIGIASAFAGGAVWNALAN